MSQTVGTASAKALRWGAARKKPVRWNRGREGEWEVGGRTRRASWVSARTTAFSCMRWEPWKTEQRRDMV